MLSRPLDGPIDSGNANPATATAMTPDDDVERSGSLDQDLDQEEGGDHFGAMSVPVKPKLSTYETVDGSMDLEDERFGGSARQGSVLASRSR